MNSRSVLPPYPTPTAPPSEPTYSPASTRLPLQVPPPFSQAQSATSAIPTVPPATSDLKYPPEKPLQQSSMMQPPVPPAVQPGTQPGTQPDTQAPLQQGLGPGPQDSSSTISSASMGQPSPHQAQQGNSMQPQGMNSVKPPPLAPIQVPGQGTMYPIMGPNGQVTYSFQPPGSQQQHMPQQGDMNGMGMQGGMNNMPSTGDMNGMGMQGGMNGMGMQGGMNGMGMQGGMNGMGMQGGMNGMGMQGNMNGMGMQGNMNGMGMQGNMNGMGMQGGMNGMGMQGNMSNMPMQVGMNGMGMQGGMNGMGMTGFGNGMNGITQQPAMGGHAINVLPGGGLQLKRVGGFKDMNSQIHDLPEVTITNVEEAGNRLFALKTKINELQAKHDSYKTRQVANGGVAAASALFTFGTSLLVQGPAAVHQHNRMKTIKLAMGPCLEQINILREAYGKHPTWAQTESTITITEKVFNGGIDRTSLNGGL